MTTASLLDATSIESMQRKVAAALISGTDLREALLADDAKHLLRALRVPRRFDQAMCEEVLFGELPPASRQALETLKQMGLVRAVSGRPGWLEAVEDTAPTRSDSHDDGVDVLAIGGARWRALHRALATRFDSLGVDGELEGLYHWMMLGEQSAELRWNALYDGARDAFDLARCETLLKLLDACARFVSAELATRGTQERGLLAARSAFADDHSRTSRYLERNALRHAFEAFLVDERHFILQLHAAGGSGKTMFLRWLGPRWCLPKGVPIARVDFDFLDVTERGLHAAFMLGKLAERLNQQLPGAPLFELLRDIAQERRRVLARPFEFDAKALSRLEAEVRQRLARVLVEHCSGRCVALVFDTMEDASLKHELDMLALIESIAALRRQLKEFAVDRSAPRLVLLLAGRYRLEEQYPQAHETFSGDLVDFEIPPFDAEESHVYLQRRLAGIAQAPAPEVVDVIIKRARGNPFKLSLYADILLSEPDITAGALGQDVDVDMLYLIERILRRIDDDALRWLLRYGVLARRLTRSFVEQVLLAPMRNSLRGNRRDDDPLEDDVRHREWPRLWVARRAPPLQPADLTDLWQRLRSYASASSWIGIDADGADAVVIQPIASHPMRRALLHKDRRVVSQIHRAAIAHARRSPVSGAVLADLTYHDFALRGSRAACSWWTLIRSCLDNGELEQVQALASVVLSEDLRESELPSREEVQGSLVDEGTRARAFHCLAKVHCLNWKRDPALEGKALSRARAFLEQFDEVAKTLDVPVVDRVSDSMLRLDLWGHEAEHRDRAVHSLEAALRSRLDARVRGQVLATLHRIWVPLDAKRALHFARRRMHWAIRTGDARALGSMLLLQVRDQRSRGQPMAALKTLVNGQQMLKSRAAHWLVRGDAHQAAREFRDEEPITLSAAGLVGAALRREEQLHFPTNIGTDKPASFAARSNRAALLLASGRLRDAMQASEEMRKTLPGGSARGTLRDKSLRLEILNLQAQTSRRMMQFDDAFDAMSQIAAMHSQIGDHSAEVATRLQMARMQLLDIGDLQLAAEQLQDRDDALADEAIPLRFEHAQLRASLAWLRGDARRAVALLDTAVELQRQRPAGHERLRAGVDLAVAGLRMSPPGLQVTHLRDLCNHWSTMDYVGARLSASTGLRHVQTLDQLPADICRRLETLSRIVPLHLAGHQRLLADDRIRLTLLRVDLLRVIGRTARAERELRGLGYALHQHPAGQWMRAVARCCDRLGVSPDDILPAGWFARVVSGARRTPYLMALIYLEAAERSAKLEQSARKVQSLLDHSTRAWNPDKAPRSFLHVRQLSLQARLRAPDSGKPDRLARRLVELRERLGCQPEKEAPPPLDTESQADVAALSLPTVAIELRWIAPGEVFNVKHAANSRESSTRYSRDLETEFDRSLTRFGYAGEIAAYETIVDAMLRPPAGEFVTQMADASISPETRERLAAAQADKLTPIEMTVGSRHKRLRILPWELMTPRGDDSLASRSEETLPITLRRGVGSFWRCPFPFTLRPRIAWAQRALNELSGGGLNEDAHFGRRTMKALSKFQESNGIRVSGIIDAETMAMLANCAQARRLQRGALSPCRVLLITPDRETTISNQRGSEAQGTSLSWTYRERGVFVDTLHEPDIELLRKKLEERFDVVHIAGPLAQSRSSGGLSLQFAASHEDSHATALGPGVLARVLSNSPLVIIEVPRSSSESETVMQLLLRNVFASVLFDQGELANIIALGLTQPAEQQLMCDTLVDALSQRAAPAEIVRRLRGLPTFGPSHVTHLFSTAGIALFSRDPFITELPRPAS